MHSSNRFVIRGIQTLKSGLQKDLFLGCFNYLFFPMTHKVLNDEDQKELSSKFEEAEKEIGQDVHERLEKMAEKLASEIQ